MNCREMIRNTSESLLGEFNRVWRVWKTVYLVGRGGGGLHI